MDDSAFQLATTRLHRLESEMACVLRGQGEAIRLTVICFLSGGHLLIEDVPGVGKTTLARTFAQCLGLPWRRIQFTGDILPSDILGVNIFDPAKREFTFHEGPIFTNILLADEINRAEPRAQSALLEAMFENQVTVDGKTRPLPQPFMVIATQNPVDFSGTYPLPDSQLDRFHIRISMGYPDAESEKLLLRRGTPYVPEAVLKPDDIPSLKSLVDEITIADEVLDLLLAIVHATRNDARIIQGASTRAMLDMRRAACARALVMGRPFVLPEDVLSLAPFSLSHRIRLAPNDTADDFAIIEDICEKVVV